MRVNSYFFKMLKTSVISMLISIALLFAFSESLAFVFTGANKMESYTWYYHRQYLKKSGGKADEVISIYDVSTDDNSRSAREWLTMHLDTLLEYPPHTLIFDICLSDEIQSKYDGVIIERIRNLRDCQTRVIVASDYDRHSSKFIHSFFHDSLDLEYGHVCIDEYESPMKVSVSSSDETLYWLPAMLNSGYESLDIPKNKRVDYTKKDIRRVRFDSSPEDKEAMLKGKIVILGCDDYKDRHELDFLKYDPSYDDHNKMFGADYLAHAVSSFYRDRWVTLLGRFPSILICFLFLLLFYFVIDCTHSLCEKIPFKTEWKAFINVLCTLLLIFIFELYVIPMCGSLFMSDLMLRLTGTRVSFDLAYALLAVPILSSVKSVIH